MVLLKNDHATLPLSKALQTVAVVGPNANALASLEGNYNGTASHPVTPLAALEERLPGHILYAQGSPYADGIPLPVPSTVFSASASHPNQRGLKAEYFNGAHIGGSPVLSRMDSNIDFDWNGASPVTGVSGKVFSVRWSGFITAPAQGTIEFGFSMAHCSTCEDSENVRVWLDDKQVYDFTHQATHGRRAPTTTFNLTFSDARPHPIRIEYVHSAAHFGAGLTFNWKPPATVLCEQASAVAAKSDVILAFLGLSPDIEGEEMQVHVKGFDGGDRSAIELPETQQRLVEALAATGKPLVIVLMNGSAIALQGAGQKASAILEAWYPGQAGGTAISESLFGESNPSGRLPVTFYASTSQLPRFDDYSMKERTYRYFTGTPLYSFGYGLSYTNFEYTAGKLSSTFLQAGDSLEASVQLKNTGDRDGDETVEMYLVPKGIDGAPIQALAGFEKIRLLKGETREIHTHIDARQLSIVDPEGNRVIEPGDYEIYIGGNQPSQENGVSMKFQIRGSIRLDP
jgi:beta-glucosidase